MNPRTEHLTMFLASVGWADAKRHSIAGDASNRRYFRLTQADGRSAVLMDAPPEKGEDVRPFQAVTDLLRNQGLSAPEIYGADTAAGFLLLEDLGDSLFVRVVKDTPAREDVLYNAAVDVLIALQKQPAPPGLPAYDISTYQREAALLPDWYLQAAPGPATRAQTLADLLSPLLAVVCSTESPVIILRDYHAENLLWLADRQANARVGLLDYQDALAGHPAYDLVSLLEDARRDISESLQAKMLQRYLSATGRDVADYKQAYATLGAQRNIKILGIFSRLWLRDGKPQYLDLLPRVWSHLERDLAHPALQDLREWVDDNVPPPDRAYRAALRALGG